MSFITLSNESIKFDPEANFKYSYITQNGVRYLHLDAISKSKAKITDDIRITLLFTGYEKFTVLNFNMTEHENNIKAEKEAKIKQHMAQVKSKEEFKKKTKKYTKQGYTQFIANYYVNHGGKGIKGHKKYKEISNETFIAAKVSGIGIDNYIQQIFKYTKLSEIKGTDLQSIRGVNPYEIKGQPYNEALGKPFQVLGERSALYKIDGELVRIDFPNSPLIYGQSTGSRYRSEDAVTMYAIAPYEYTTAMRTLNIIPRFVVVK